MRLKAVRLGRGEVLISARCGSNPAHCERGQQSAWLVTRGRSAPARRSPGCAQVGLAHQQRLAGLAGARELVHVDHALVARGRGAHRGRPRVICGRADASAGASSSLTNAAPPCPGQRGHWRRALPASHSTLIRSTMNSATASALAAMTSAAPHGAARPRNFCGRAGRVSAVGGARMFGRAEPAERGPHKNVQGVLEHEVPARSHAHPRQ